MRALTKRGSYMHIHRPSIDVQVNGFFKGLDFFHRSFPRLSTSVPSRRSLETKANMFSTTT